MAPPEPHLSTGKTFLWAWPVTVALALAGGWEALRRFGVRPDTRLLSPSLRVGVPVALLVCFGVLTALALLLPTRRAVIVAAAAILVGGLAVTVGNPEGFRPHGLNVSQSCVGIGVCVGFAPLCVGLLAMWRRGVREHGAAVGAALGASAGLAGLAVLHVRCALVGASHGLVLHEGSLLVVTLIGALAGRRLGRAMAQRGAPR